MTDRPPATLLRAAWVAPMDGPPFRDGGVLVEGERIAAVGPADKLRRMSPDAVHDCGEAVIFPGLVNAHIHLELSHLTPPQNPGSFVDWLMNVIGSAGDEAAIAGAAARGAAECLRHGVTTVGDISRRPGLIRAALPGPLRGVSFGEVVGMAKRRAVLRDLLKAAVTGSPIDRLRPGVSPHAPYSVDADGYRQCLAAARQHRLPLTTHLAESPDEAAFLSDHAGPFRELWERIGAWDGGAVSRFAGGPIRYAASLGLLDYDPVALAHVNYCDNEEISLLARGRGSVVYCPRTHAYFDHPPHRWREMLAAGINVAVGTDSRASSPDLNLVDELRLLHRIAPEVPAPDLWAMATTRAAKALGLNGEVGSLRKDGWADLAVFPARANEPLLGILESHVQPLEVWVAGKRV